MGQGRCALVDHRGAQKSPRETGYCTPPGSSLPDRMQESWGGSQESALFLLNAPRPLLGDPVVRIRDCAWKRRLSSHTLPQPGVGTWGKAKGFESWMFLWLGPDCLVTPSHTTSHFLPRRPLFLFPWTPCCQTSHYSVLFPVS